MTKLLIPLVGSHFHPPAKQLLAGLPAGIALALVPEPDNPYDANAVLVHLAVADIPPTCYARLALELDGTGTELEGLLAAADTPVVLGHCAASGGKPIGKLQAGCSEKLSGTLEVIELLANTSGTNAEAPLKYAAKLAFLPDGSPAIEVVA